VVENKQVTDKKFDNKVEWGIDLASEHERCVRQNHHLDIMLKIKMPNIVFLIPFKFFKLLHLGICEGEKMGSCFNVLLSKLMQIFNKRYLKTQ
jgi:asparaginyl-tRNA synthetase